MAAGMATAATAMRCVDADLRGKVARAGCSTGDMVRMRMRMPRVMTRGRLGQMRNPLEGDGRGRTMCYAKPSRVTEPRKQPNLKPLTCGFTYLAERWNSRAAMVGFMMLLLIEAIARKGLLELFGFQVGKGLGFE